MWTDPDGTTPSIVQIDFGPWGQDVPGDGYAYCGPTSMVMGLYYLYANGFTQLAPRQPGRFGDRQSRTNHRRPVPHVDLGRHVRERAAAWHRPLFVRLRHLAKPVCLHEHRQSRSLLARRAIGSQCRGRPDTPQNFSYGRGNFGLKWQGWTVCLTWTPAKTPQSLIDRRQNRGRRKSCAAGRTPRRLGFAPTRCAIALARPAVTVARKVI
jgi:hypothetical protein